MAEIFVEINPYDPPEAALNDPTEKSTESLLSVLAEVFLYGFFFFLCLMVMFGIVVVYGFLTAP